MQSAVAKKRPVGKGEKTPRLLFHGVSPIAPPNPVPFIYQPSETAQKPDSDPRDTARLRYR
jgi:hypothetical protein